MKQTVSVTICVRGMGSHVSFLHPVPESQQPGIYTPRQEIRKKPINTDLWRSTNEKASLTPLPLMPLILQGSPPVSEPSPCTQSLTCVSLSNMNRQLKITTFLERKTSATVQASAQDRLQLKGAAGKSFIKEPFTEAGTTAGKLLFLRELLEHALHQSKRPISRRRKTGSR